MSGNEAWGRKSAESGKTGGSSVKKRRFLG